MSELPSNQIECTRCGASVHAELTTCPHCGLNFYQPQSDDWQEHWTEPGPEGTWFSLVMLVFLGWLVAAGLAWLLHLVFHRAWQASPAGYWWASIGLFVGVALGSWLVAHLAEERQLLVAAGVGVSSIGTAILFDGFRQDLSVEGILRAETLLVWGILVGTSLLVGWWQGRQALRVDHLLFPTDTEQALYDQLLARVRYDRATVERLIQYERQRQPQGTRLIWLRSALRRWERDNR